MLEKLDLSLKTSKSEYKQIMPDMELMLGELQRKARALGVPVIILFEGWSASGKGTQLNKLILPLDPRGFNVYSTNPPNEEEQYRPFLWRFWVKTPAKGRMTLFDRSWYQRVLTDRVDKVVKKAHWNQTFREINSFEKQLSDEGTVLIKFFLHIDKKTQKKRFQELESDPATKWRVTKRDWEKHREYDDYLKATEEMLEQTDTDYAPWTLLEAIDERFTTVKIFLTVIQRLEEKIKALENKAPHTKTLSKSNTHPDDPFTTSILDRTDVTKSLSREDYEKKKKILQEQWRDIEYELFRQRRSMMILYEGWDAAGKGGNIKRITENLDPRGYEVVPIAAPTEIEKSHHYLWRFWTHIPKAGHIAIFDRTWYGRVLVERIEGFCTVPEWKRAYQEINEMESQFASFGIILVKFWLHISKEEQLKRFKEREALDYKQWKITDEDWRNREKWNLYKTAVDEMLLKTSTSYAPWTVVEANDKLYARIKTLKTVVQAAKSILTK